MTSINDLDPQERQEPHGGETHNGSSNVNHTASQSGLTIWSKLNTSQLAKLATETRPVRYLRTNEFVVPFLFLLPALFMLFMTYFYPIVRVVRDSFFRFSGGAGRGRGVFVELTNYRILLDDPNIKTAVENNTKLLLAIPIILFLSIVIAFLFNEEVFGAKVYQTLIFIPTVISVVVVGVLFTFLLMPSGMVNDVLKSAGLDFLAVSWLGDPKIAIYTVMGVIVWKELGFGIMLFRARIAGLEPELFDAAKVDGANTPQVLRYIVLPQLKGIIEFFVTLYVIWIFASVFGYIFTLTGGGPAEHTTVLDFEIYQYAFLRNNRGVASALSLMLLLGVGFFIYLEYRLRRRMSAEG